MAEKGQPTPSEDRRPLWYGIAAGIVILSSAVSYRIIKSDGPVDFSGGVNGIEVKISQAQKTIESAQREMSAAQEQLDERAAALKKMEKELHEREARIDQLLASLTPTPSAAPRLSVKQARAELEKIQAQPVAMAPAEPMAVKPRLDKLEELRTSLQKTNTELKAAGRPAPEP
jgi:chromosome segregation ATPase